MNKKEELEFKKVVDNEIYKLTLFKSYGIDESHSERNEVIDNWNEVEIFRIMHDGHLPKGDDTSAIFFLDFLNDKENLDKYNPSYLLTAKRAVYAYHENIIKEVMENKDNV